MIARGSALECAACLDVLVVRNSLVPDIANTGKATLVRVVSMVTKLIDKLLERTSTSMGLPGFCGHRVSGSTLELHRASVAQVRV